MGSKSPTDAAEEVHDGCCSQQSTSALSRSTAAEQHFALHAAHLIVVVPGQLRAGPDPSARGHEQASECRTRAHRYVNLKVNTLHGFHFNNHLSWRQ